MVPVLALAIVAFVVIRSLMWVGAHDEGAGARSLSTEYAPVQSYDPTVQLRARVHDDARGFLLPAVTESEPVDVDVNVEHDIDIAAS